jgi:hypothetical protein
MYMPLVDSTLLEKSNSYSVADPDHFDTDPDPGFHFDTDPDPGFHFDTDPDPIFFSL